MATKYDLSSLSYAQLSRLYRQTWDRLERHNGGMPYGYDARTLAIAFPRHWSILSACLAYAERLLHA